MATNGKAALQARVDELEAVLAEAYQLAGAIGAPKRVLDNLAAAIDERPLPRQTFLPVQAEECGEVAALLTLLNGTAASVFGRAGGQARSRSKTAAARANGAKGGRPRKPARASR